MSFQSTRSNSLADGQADESYHPGPTEPDYPKSVDVETLEKESRCRTNSSFSQLGEIMRDNGISFINEACEARNFPLRAHDTPNKGRILVSSRSFREGEVIAREPPLHIVCEDEKNPAFQKLRKFMDSADPEEYEFDYEPLWYWAALQSLTDKDLKKEYTVEGAKRKGRGEGQGRFLEAVHEDTQLRLRLLHQPDSLEVSQDVSEICKALKLPEGAAKRVEEMLQIWIHNCFEYSEEPLGYATFFLPSFMSHSCAPNAAWFIEEPEHGGQPTFVLKTRRPVQAGEEITVTYLSEDAMLESSGCRRSSLQSTKSFWCQCERCGAPRDLARGFRFQDQKVFVPTELPMWENEPIPDQYFEEMEDEVPRESLLEFLKSEKDLYRRLKAIKAVHAEDGEGPSLSDVKERISEAYAKNLRHLVTRVLKCDTTHWLADRMWSVLTDFYHANLNFSESIACAYKRIQFIRTAYPEEYGLHGGEGWVWEEIGDIASAGFFYKHKIYLKKRLGRTLKIDDVSSDPVALNKVILTSSQVRELQDETRCEALFAYQKSCEIMKGMFSEKHEYFESPHKKLETLKMLILKSEMENN